MTRSRTRRGPDVGETRWCLLCGRRGTRGFLRIDGKPVERPGGAVVCEAQTECRARKSAKMGPLDRPVR